MIITFEYGDCEVIADAIVRRIKEEKKFSSDINDIKDALWVEIEDILFPVSYTLYDANDIDVTYIGCGRGTLDYDSRLIENLVINKLHISYD